MYTEIHLAPDQLATLKHCARGVYQRALLAGNEAWSGATLRGTAASYGYWYARSRRNLLARIRASGIAVHEERRAHGRRVVVIGAAA